MTRSSIIRRFCALVAVVAITAVTVFAGIPARPSHQRLVNDFANVFTAEQADSLERMLVAFDDTTSNQITIVTVADLEGYAVDDYAIKLGREWGIGTKERNNGVLVLVKPKNSNGGGRVTIQVGYGLEGAIPDVYAKRIIDQIMIPSFKENDYFRAVSEACENLMGLASGEIAEPRQRKEESDWPSILIFWLLFIVCMYVVTRKSKKNTGYTGTGGAGPVIFTGPLSWLNDDDGRRGRGGHHHYGGGWGGGSSWGGGGFGGFGGGSFGGGGASGSW